MSMGPQQYLGAVPWIDLPDPDIDGFVGALGRRFNFDLAEKLLSWKTNGFVIFEQVVSHEAIDALIADVGLIRDRFHDYLIPIEIAGRHTWSKAVRREEIEGTGVKFNHLHVSSYHAARLSLTREVVEFLSCVFEAPPVPMQSLTFWRGSEQLAHIDFPYVCRQRRLAYMAASWIPLEDVNPDAGPLAYFPGGHRPDVTGFFDWGKGDILCRQETRERSGTEFAQWIEKQMSIAAIAPKVFLPRKGDVLIWHGNMPHTGTRVKNPELTRKSYVTHFTALPDYPDTWIPSDLESNAIRMNGGMVIDFPWSKPESKLPSWQARPRATAERET